MVTSQNRIIKVVQRLFAGNGSQVSEISDSITLVDISRCSSSYYFEKRDEMYRIVFEGVVISIASEIERVISQDKPISKQIGKIVDACLRLFTDNPCLSVFLMQETERNVNYLLEAMGELQIESHFRNFITGLQDEMKTGKLKEVPLSYVFYTFYGLLTAPFLTKELTSSLFPKGKGEDFNSTLSQWRSYIVMQMENLLCYK